MSIESAPTFVAAKQDPAAESFVSHLVGRFCLLREVTHRAETSTTIIRRRIHIRLSVGLVRPTGTDTSHRVPLAPPVRVSIDRPSGYKKRMTLKPPSGQWHKQPFTHSKEFSAWHNNTH